MIRRTLMNSTMLDEWMITTHVKCIYMHIAEQEDRWQSLPHKHEYNEICYVAWGSGKYLIDGAEYSMQANDIFFLPKACMHCEVQESWEAYELRFLMVETQGEHAQDIDEYFFGKPARLRSKNPYEVRRLFDLITSEVIEHNDGYLSIVEDALKHLYVLLWRQAEAASSNQKRSVSGGSLPRREFLPERLRAWVLDHLESNFTVDEIADAFHYHPKYLTTIIKQETHKTLTECILSIRLDHACELLAHTPYAIGDIIAQCGFVNSAHFYRVFKQRTGMTPQQYRHTRLNAPRDSVVKR